MKRMINMGSIGTFRTTVKNIQFQSQYTGTKDEEGNPILDRTAKAPVIKVKYSEKTNGTNLGICYNNKTDFYVQSRKNIITPEKDNAGSAFAAYANKDAWMKIINNLAEFHDIDLDNSIITIYAEWCGNGIQKKANVTGEEKMSIIFDYFKVSPLEPSEDESSEWYETITIQTAYNPWIETWVDSPEHRIFNVNNFPDATGYIDIDFERPDIANNELIKIMEEFESNSPIARYFGHPENVGEGIVCTFVFNGTRNAFKVKGESHSKGKTRVKTLKPVDSVLEQKKIDFVNEYACTESRLNQMWTEIVHSVHNGNESLMDMKDMGNFLKLVQQDTVKEEMDIMSERGLEPKMINSTLSKVARNWFIEQLNGGIGL